MPDFNMPISACQRAHDAASPDPATHFSDSPVSEWEQQLHGTEHEGEEAIALQKLPQYSSGRLANEPNTGGSFSGNEASATDAGHLSYSLQGSNVVNNGSQINQPEEARGSHVEGQGGQTNDKLTDANLQRLAQGTYQENRLYHGTSQDQARIMRDEGMDTKNKTGTTVDKAISKGYFSASSFEDVEKFKEQSNSYNFLTNKKEFGLFVPGAKNYARLAASEGDPPHIMRVMLSKEGHGLEPDAESNVGGTVSNNPSFRTRSKIPAGNIFPSKNAPVKVTDASEVFKERLNTSDNRPSLKVNTTLTSEQAAQLLHEQQTPSATDFSEDPG